MKAFNCQSAASADPGIILGFAQLRGEHCSVINTCFRVSGIFLPMTDTQYLDAYQLVVHIVVATCGQACILCWQLQRMADCGNTLWRMALDPFHCHL